MDVRVSCYSPELPSYHYGSRAHPAVGGFMARGFFGGARARGERPVFVLEGPDAEEAAERIRGTINRHPSEVLPKPPPPKPPPPKPADLNAVMRDRLERLGYLKDFDEMMRGGRGT